MQNKDITPNQRICFLHFENLKINHTHWLKNLKMTTVNIKKITVQKYLQKFLKTKFTLIKFNYVHNCKNSCNGKTNIRWPYRYIFTISYF